MSQSLANILIQVIWSTKDRRPLISNGTREGLHGYISGILKNLESPALIINSVADHIHVLCQLSKNLAACKLIEEVKKSSSKWMKENGVGEFAWQSGLVFFQLVSQVWTSFVDTSQGRRNITRRRILKTNFASFAKNIMSCWMNVMYGIDFVTPFQGSDCFRVSISQGVALGCLVARFQRVNGETLVWRKNSRC